MKRLFVLILVAAVVALAALALVSAFSPGRETAVTAQAPPFEVRTLLLRGDTISERLELTGEIEPEVEARLASAAEGPVRGLRVREGDRVRRGQTILSIGRSAGAAAAIDAAYERERVEEENLRRTERLVEIGAIPGERLDQARAAVEAARAQTTLARERTGDFSIEAPWDGIVSRVMVDEGDYVVPRTPLVEIYAPARMLLRFAVPEGHAAAMRTGLRLSVALDAYPDTVLRANVTRVYPTLDERFRTRTVEAEILDRVPLLPGMFARVTLDLSSSAEYPTAPTSVVSVTPEGRHIVYVLEDGTAHRREVTLGVEAGDRVQITGGVRSGETLIVSGIPRMREGLPVRAASSSAEAREDTPGDSVTER